MTDPVSPSWRQRALSALVVVLLVALGARVAYELLRPLVPTLIILVCLIILYWVVLGRKKN